VIPKAVQQDRQEPELTERERERERERHPGEVRGDAGEREQEGAEQAWQPARITAYASRSPKIPPSTAVTKLTSIVVQKAPGMIPVVRFA
jgi:hypothetical protein